MKSKGFSFSGGRLFRPVFLSAVLASPSAFAQAPAEAPAGQFSQIVDKLTATSPGFSPGSEIISWNGQNWSVTNNRFFESQFEKYLATPQVDIGQGNAYRLTLERINRLLSGYPISPGNLDEAFRLLTNAAAYPQDGNMSDVLANQIYMAWMAQKNNDRLQKAGVSMEQERQRLEWNMQMAVQPSSMGGQKSAGVSMPGGGGASLPSLPSASSGAETAAKVQPIAQRLAEVNTLMKANNAKSEMSLAQARTDFQALLVQFFVQRRFDHLTIGVKFYRNIFGDGSSQVKVGDDAAGVFAKTTGNPPTLSSLDAMGREATQNVRQGTQAFYSMMDANQTQSAGKRLSEAYVVGEHLFEIQVVPLDQKQKILQVTQKVNQLISAIDVKNYELAGKLVGELKGLASDLDTSKADAAVQTAQMAAEMHLAKARNAAVAGDKDTLEKELQAAAEIWPTNPQLKEMSATIFSEADVQARTLSDFDQLVSQKNYRQIYDDKMRFIAATAMIPEKRDKLKEVLENMQAIETAILQADEISKRGDSAGAWESIEAVYTKFPNDNKLNQLRADLSTKASDFVNALSRANGLEQRNQLGSALTAYLEAKKIYPPSQFAKDGILRIRNKILPDAQ